ncbi:10117_t:CDS:2, partial [Scutellospora calospora]
LSACSLSRAPQYGHIKVETLWDIDASTLGFSYRIAKFFNYNNF